MSSLFTEAEIQLARVGLADFRTDALYVVVGGLGLDYTAVAALKNASVRSLLRCRPGRDNWTPLTLKQRLVALKVNR